MSLIPAFEFGILNAWLFTVWLILIPIFTSLFIKDKNTSKKLQTSAPVKYEKPLNIMSMAVVIFGFLYSIFLPIEFDTIWFYTGLIIFLIGLILYISTIVTLRNVSVDDPFVKGSYKISRHPGYVSMIFIFISVIIICLSWIFIVLLGLLLFHLAIAVPAEERYCLEKYGKKYKRYLEKTPRWIGLPKK